MLRILDRYIFREVAATWLAVTVVLLFILMTNQFARVLGEVAKGNLPRGAVFEVIGLTAVQYMTVLIPIGLFLSIMLALGRLYRDSELPAMMACRVGPGGIYRPIAWIMLPLALSVGWISMETGPQARVEIERISVEARRQADLASIEPGKFLQGREGAVVYAENVPGPGRVEKVFVQQIDELGKVSVVIAESGEQRDSDDPNTRYFVLKDGRRYEGIPGSAEFRVMDFAEHGIPYQLPGAESTTPRAQAKPTAELLKSTDLMDLAELHFRLAVPIATLILAILAVPLSRSQPRSGRYGKLAIGLLVFIIYFNLMSAGKAWIETATVAPAVGLWWVHGLMLSFAIILIGAQNGVHRRILSVRLF
jgi:lipopolysaccharide export system permease protein